MVLKSLIFFTGTPASGQTTEDPLKIGENPAKEMASHDIKNYGELESSL